MAYNYLNLTNGIEAIPNIKGDYRFIRIQSTMCEQKNWDRLIQELDYDFLMNLALGNSCIVYDFGANKPKSRAMYQGLEFVKYILNRRWLNKEYITKINRGNTIFNCNSYFSQCYDRLDTRTKKKLDYFIPFVQTDIIDLDYISNSTTHDNDKEFYKDILKKYN